MTVNELRGQEITAVKDNLLDSQISSAMSSDNSVTAKFQREAELLRDGLSSGFNARVEHAQENIAATTLEVAGSFAIGSTLAWMAKAGGRWGTAAKVVGGAFTVLMVGDVGRRAAPTWGAVADTWNSEVNLAHNKEVVGHYAGSALFDYPVMLGSGMAGAGAVHFGPKVAEMFKTMREPGTLSSSSHLSLEMSLGETARLGAKEKGKLADLDPLMDVRARLEKPNQKTMQLGDLADVMTAKRLAAHPEVAPLRGSMLETLGKIDTLKPEIATNRSNLTAAERQVADVKGLKAETRAVEAAQRNVEALQTEQARLQELRADEARLQTELRAKGEEGSTARDPEVVRQELSDVRQDIRGCQARIETVPAAQARVVEAQTALQKRQRAIEAGTDGELTAFEKKVNNLRDNLAKQEGQLADLSTELRRLDGQFTLKAVEVTPTLDQTAIPKSVPDLVRAKPGDAIRQPKLERPATEVVPPAKPADALKPVEIPPAKPLQQAPDAIKAALEKPEFNPAKPNGGRVEAKPSPELNRPQVNDRPQGQRQPERQPERQPDRPGDRNRNEPERQPERFGERPPVGEREVNRALQDAQRAVDDFHRTGARHTTALKGVAEYLNKATEWFGNDSAATGRSREILANVEGMLGKVKNWERGASWVPKHGPERAQLMSRNGMTAEQMAKFDNWADSVRGNYQPKPNQMAEMTLADIQLHLENRVRVESVKWYLKQAPDTAASTSPIVEKGFDMVREGRYPDGSPIHPDADLIVFEQRTIKGQDGNPMDVIVPYGKDGQHIQRFDAVHIVNGMRKQNLIKTEGPAALTPDELYGFRLDHDPSRLTGARQQVGFAILRPGGHGKNIAYMEFKPGVDTTLLPKQLRADVPGGAPGTNTGSLYNMLRGLSSGPQRRSGVALGVNDARPPADPNLDGLPNLEIK